MKGSGELSLLYLPLFVSVKLFQNLKNYTNECQKTYVNDTWLDLSYGTILVHIDVLLKGD